MLRALSPVSFQALLSQRPSLMFSVTHEGLFVNPWTVKFTGPLSLTDSRLAYIILNRFSKFSPISFYYLFLLELIFVKKLLDGRYSINNKFLNSNFKDKDCVPLGSQRNIGGWRKPQRCEPGQGSEGSGVLCYRTWMSRDLAEQRRDWKWSLGVGSSGQTWSPEGQWQSD